MKNIVAFVCILILCNDIALGQNSVAFIDSLRQSNHIPELNYAVVKSEKILEINSLGHHSINLNDTATLGDRFHIGSNTKAMTAFIIARYVEHGKLKWDSKFFEVFPEWKSTSKQEYYQITLEELLSHRAGIQPFLGVDDPEIPNFCGSKREKRAQFGKWILTLDSVKSDEHNNFNYSNADYTLATLMIEKCTGKSWEELVDKVFNKELKLDVKLSWPENQEHSDTWGHYEEDGKLIAVPSNSDFKLDYTEPAGDINISLPNYIKFIQMNLDGLNGGNNYLRAKTYQYLHNQFEYYSLGWFNITENYNSFSTHFGTAGTYYTLVSIDKAAKTAYIIFTNSYSQETEKGVKLIMRELKSNYKLIFQE